MATATGSEGLCISGTHPIYHMLLAILTYFPLSCCGYHHLKRQERETKKKDAKAARTGIPAKAPKTQGMHTIPVGITCITNVVAADGNKKQWARSVAYDFTGCLAHLDITYLQSTGQVTRVRGILDHNATCITSKMNRVPAVPLHPHVYEVALHQLRNLAS